MKAVLKSAIACSCVGDGGEVDQTKFPKILSNGANINVY